MIKDVNIFVITVHQDDWDTALLRAKHSIRVYGPSRSGYHSEKKSVVLYHIAWRDSESMLPSGHYESIQQLNPPPNGQNNGVFQNTDEFIRLLLAPSAIAQSAVPSSLSMAFDRGHIFESGFPLVSPPRQRAASSQRTTRTAAALKTKARKRLSCALRNVPRQDEKS
mmetsp:Transcript_6877/g.16870  ORF Transcript_6877/g.16870 Transcript_6877/m.16870 type:complete len:167 (+) Transcript_6877:690-1190(+)